MFYYIHDEFIIARRFHVPGIYDAVKIAEIVTLITCVSRFSVARKSTDIFETRKRPRTTTFIFL